MKQQLLKKTLLLLTFIGLCSTQLNAQDEVFHNNSADGLWSTLANWASDDANTTPSLAFPTGEAKIKFNVDLNGNQTVTSIVAALASANPITVSGGTLTLGSSTNNATILNNNINNQFILDCDITVNSSVFQRFRNKNNANSILIFSTGRTIALGASRMKIRNESAVNNVQINGTVTGTNSIELEGGSTNNTWGNVTFGPTSDFSGFTGDYFLYRFEIESNTNTVFIKANKRIQFANIGGILTVNGANTVEGEIRRNNWTGGIGESTVNFNANQNNMAKLTISGDEKVTFNIDPAVTELYFTTSTFSATSILNLNGHTNGVLKFDNTVSQTVLDTWQLNGVEPADGTLTQDGSGFINTACSVPTDVTGFTVTDATTGAQLDLAWTNGSCFDEILVVAKEASAVTVTPTGDGTAYTADAVFASGTDLGTDEYAVFKGSGNSVAITGLTDDTVYHFTVFARKGTSWSTGVVGNGTPTVPTVTFDGFVQNPSFDDLPGDIAPWSPANKPYATVDVTTGDARTGTYSMTHTYHTVAPSGGAHFVFNSYVHDIGSTISDAITSSLWVKVVRPSTPGVSPLVSIQGQVRTGTVPGTLALKSNNQTTTKTDGTWEKLTFNLLTPDAAYQYAQFRYGLQITNLQIGDIVYIDDLSAINVASDTSAQDGNWEDSSTWVSGNIPDANTNLTIAHNISINSDAECFSMSINNTAATLVSVSAGNSLTIETDVTTSNDIFLLSNSSSFSSLIVNGSISGQISYQRYVAAESTRDLISVPVNGLTFGSFSTAGFNAQLYENPLVTTEKLFGPFDNATGAYVSYDEVADAAEVLVPGKGYRAATNSGSVLRFKNSGFTGDVSVAVTDEAAGTGNFKRWNLIGNPYPSYLDFGEFFTENSSEFDAGAYQAIYGYDGDASNGWVVWNNLNSADKIAPGQGFFVRAKVGGGSVTFKPTMQTIGSSDDFIMGRGVTAPNFVLSEFFLNTGSEMYSTKIYFADDQTRGLDPGYDAGAYGGDGNGLYTQLVEDDEGVNFAIQALPYNDFNDVIVPLGVKSNSGVQTTIGLNMTTTDIPNNINVYLEDNVANTWTLLNNSDYVFTPTAAVSGVGRFYLHFSASVLSVVDNAFDGLNIYTEQSTKEVIVKGQLNSDTVATIYDIRGRNVLTKSLDTNSTSNAIDVNNLVTGIYIVKLKNTSGSKSQKIILK